MIINFLNKKKHVLLIWRVTKPILEIIGFLRSSSHILNYLFENLIEKFKIFHFECNIYPLIIKTKIKPWNSSIYNKNKEINWKIYQVKRNLRFCYTYRGPNKFFECTRQIKVSLFMGWRENMMPRTVISFHSQDGARATAAQFTVPIVSRKRMKQAFLVQIFRNNLAKK